MEAFVPSILFCICMYIHTSTYPTAHVINMYVCMSVPELKAWPGDQYYDRRGGKRHLKKICDRMKCDTDAQIFIIRVVRLSLFFNLLYTAC